MLELHSAMSCKLMSESRLVWNNPSYGCMRMNARWGKGCKTGKTSQSHCPHTLTRKEYLCSGLATCKPPLRKHWQCDKKRNPCCRRGEGLAWELAVNLRIRGLEWTRKRGGKRGLMVAVALMRLKPKRTTGAPLGVQSGTARGVLEYILYGELSSP